jgi:glycosyltransferase involved in cell wall biosynthesis
MKIGLVIYGSLETVSGGYYYDRRLVQSLRAAGDEVTVISLSGGGYFSQLKDNLNFRLPSDLDVIIEDELCHPALIRANRQAREVSAISLVHHLRTSERHPVLNRAFFRLVEKAYLRTVDGFIFNSNTTRQAVVRLVGGEAPGIVATPPTDRFSPEMDGDTVRERARVAGPLRVVFVGNLIRRKGLAALLKAVEVCREAVCLDVIGSLEMDPLYAERMMAFADRLGLAERVRFHGTLGNEAMAAILRTGHVMAVPSEYEGYGIVYLEGMAFGLPAIGTSQGAASEIIEEGKTGYLVPPGSVDGLVNRLEVLAKDRHELAEMGMRALAHSRQQPAWEDNVAEIRAFLACEVDRYQTEGRRRR